MNAKRRAKLKEAKSYISSAVQLLDEVIDEEQEAIYNIPENLQDSQVAEDREDVLDEMNDIRDNLVECEDDLSNIL